MEAVICFLSTNSIQDLVLVFPVGSEYELPSSLYACLQLRCLTLQRCSLRPPPPVFQGFDRLVILVLSRVTISSEFLGSLISHCRLLEHLVLEEIDNSNHIEVTAPKLRLFVFKGNMHFIHLKNVPLLAKVSHESVESSVKAGKHDLTNFFESIPALEHLDWHYINFRYMVMGPAEIPTRLPSALNSLKRLYLTEFLLDELVELSCVLCLLRSSPYLEELEIKESVDLSGELLAGVDEIPAIFSDMTFNHLREVKINGVAGEWTKLELTKVLLAESPVLTKMVIDIVVEGDQFIEVKEKITQFQRASPKAEIVITMYVHGQWCLHHKYMLYGKSN